MTKIEKILIPTVLLAAGVMCVLWINAQQANSKLARELQDKQSEYEQVEAARKGLAQANDQLQARLTQVEKAALALKAAPIAIPTPTEAEVLSDELMPMQTAQREPVLRDPDAPTILSPEQLAEQQQREEERAARDAERAKQREEFMVRVQDDIQQRRAFFSQINTEGLAPEYVEAHQKLLASLDNAQVLMAKMADPDLSREDRRAIGQELWGQSREMGQLMEMQREVLLNDYAELSLGLSRSQAQEFMSYMETVNKMTSGSPMRGGGGGRGR